MHDPATEVIPSDLTRLRQWVRWRIEGVIGTPKQAKIPFQTNGARARVNDPSTWNTFGECVGGTEINESGGIGFVISSADPFTGIDLDGCLDEQGELVAWAVPIVARLVSVGYGEISPSGTGIKFLTRASKPSGFCSKKALGPGRQGIEIYDGRNQAGKPGHRWWAITTDIYASADTIADGQDEVTWLCETYLAPAQRAKPIASTASKKQPSNILVRASAYLAAKPPAISGEAGHDALYSAVCDMLRGFELTEAETFNLISNQYNPRCQPSWSERDIMHKIDDAGKETTPPIGYLKNAPRPDRLSNATSADQQKATDWLAQSINQTENYLAQRFVALYQSDIHFVPRWKAWLIWDGTRWIRDIDGGLVMQRVRAFTHGLWKDLGGAAATLTGPEVQKLTNKLRQYNSERAITAIGRLAAGDDRVRIEPELLDANAYQLNLVNGTFDFETGEVSPHRREDLITQISAIDFDPAASCPQWDETMRLVFDDDADLIVYFEQILGYAMTGITGENVMPICWGTGNNGKSTVLNTLLLMLGEYGLVGSETLLLGQNEQHPTELADLFSKRLVLLQEPPEGALLRESRMKYLTGDELISARRLYENAWSFRRTHTFVMPTNHRPRVTGTDNGVWRRLKLIPFTRDIAQIPGVSVVKDFHKILARDEAPGIFNRLCDAYVSYVINGHNFNEPEAVTSATLAYRENEDPIGEFLRDCIEERPGHQIRTSVVHAAYLSWADKNGIKRPAGNRKFTGWMESRHERKREPSGRFIYSDIDVIETAPKS
jgi:putative DNA primase/helicase